MSDQNPLTQGEEAREPTELEVLKERARKMGITFSNNIGVESLRQKIAEKQEGKAESTNADGDVPNKDPGQSLFGLSQTSNSTASTGLIASLAPAAAPVPPVTVVPTVEELQKQLAAMTSQRDDAEAAANSAVAASPINPLSNEPVVPIKVKTLQQMMRDDQTKLVRIRIQNLDPKKKDLHGEIITVANEYLGTIKKFVPYGEASDEGYHVPYCIYEFLKSKRFLNIRTTRDRVTKQIKVEHSMSLEYSIELLPQLTREDLNKLAASQAAAGSLN